jgi:hypothetical protein
MLTAGATALPAGWAGGAPLGLVSPPASVGAWPEAEASDGEEVVDDEPEAAPLLAAEDIEETEEVEDPEEEKPDVLLALDEVPAGLAFGAGPPGGGGGGAPCEPTSGVDTPTFGPAANSLGSQPGNSSSGVRGTIAPSSASPMFSRSFAPIG